VPADNVEVGRARKVDVAETEDAGDPHAVNTADIRIKLATKTKSCLVIIISSVAAYFH
jgi:hypothetical protein